MADESKKPHDDERVEELLSQLQGIFSKLSKTEEKEARDKITPPIDDKKNSPNPYALPPIPPLRPTSVPPLTPVNPQTDDSFLPPPTFFEEERTPTKPPLPEPPAEEALPNPEPFFPVVPMGPVVSPKESVPPIIPDPKPFPVQPLATPPIVQPPAPTPAPLPTFAVPQPLPVPPPPVSVPNPLPPLYPTPTPMPNFPTLEAMPPVLPVKPPTVQAPVEVPLPPAPVVPSNFPETSAPPMENPDRPNVAVAVFFPEGRENEAKLLGQKVESLSPKFTKVSFRLFAQHYGSYNPKVEWRDKVVSEVRQLGTKVVFFLEERPLEEAKKKALVAELDSMGVYLQEVPVLSVEKKAFYTDMLLGLVFFFDTHRPQS